jgi:hypothetical protein
MKKPIETCQGWYFCSYCKKLASDITRPIDRRPNIGKDYARPLGQPNRLCPDCFRKAQQARIERDKSK